MMLNKITQESLAKELGISRSYLDRMLNERVSLTKKMKSKLEQYMDEKGA
jgi:plasmid maintenance system antidote protein VapI